MSSRNSSRKAAQQGTPTTPASPATRREKRATERAGSRREQRVLAERRARRQKRLLLFGGAAALAILLVVVLIAINASGDDDDGEVADLPVSVPELTDPAIPTDGLVIGNADAPVTVVEWGDYQCPACGNWARGSEAQLVSEYVATGKVRYEYRDMAFLGDESVDAAEAARCAGDQDRYWDYHKTLFYNQSGENQGAFAKARLIEMARGLNLDEEQFTSCFNDGTHADAVQETERQANSAGVNSTPTFYVNGEQITGGNWEQIKQAIDAALQ
jgi:protein-disulfide isomerase